MKRLLCIIVLLATSPVTARVQSIKSGHTLDTVVGKRPFAVVLFYQCDRQNCTQKNNIRELQSVLNAVSQREVYRQANVAFALVNITEKRLSGIEYDYGVAQVPSVVLFNDGVIVAKERTPITLVGASITRENVLRFIDRYLKRDISAYLKDKQKERERRERNRALYGPYFYYGVGYPWGYGCYGSPYWNGGCSFGFSF